MSVPPRSLDATLTASEIDGPCEAPSVVTNVDRCPSVGRPTERRTGRRCLCLGEFAWVKERGQHLCPHLSATPQAALGNRPTIAPRALSRSSS
jgi:hypothetical protein